VTPHSAHSRPAYKNIEKTCKSQHISLADAPARDMSRKKACKTKPDAAKTDEASIEIHRCQRSGRCGTDGKCGTRWPRRITHYATDARPVIVRPRRRGLLHGGSTVLLLGIGRGIRPSDALAYRVAILKAQGSGQRFQITRRSWA
jgi:hypothetical protein